VAVAGGFASCLGAVARVLGLLDATMGRWDAAERHFELALDINQRIRAAAFVVRTQRAYAETLLARGAPGDAARAAALIEAARRAAHELALPQEAERLARIAATAIA